VSSRKRREHGRAASVARKSPAADLMAVLAHGKPVLHRTRVDLAEVVARAVETACPVLAAGDHRLTVSLPPAPVILSADGPRLQRVLVNLLANATRYGGPDRDIRLTAAAAAGLVFVRVRDDGAGIAPDLLPHVFDLDTQGPAGGRRGPDGLGFGLAVVKSIVELHGGTVTAFSHGPGTGSEFIIRLPADGAAGREAAG
jgi:signal transduction histidine kinase